MVILLRQASSNGNHHLLTLELSDWMAYNEKLHHHRRIAPLGNFSVVVELIIKKEKEKGRKEKEKEGKRKGKEKEKEGKRNRKKEGRCQIAHSM
jgi:hypothetical protein